MKNLIIIGAGGFGREVYNWALEHPQHKKEWQIKGFLDDDRNALNPYSFPVPVMDTIANYITEPDDVFICAIAKPQEKKAAVKSISNKGGTFINLIHPSVKMGLDVSMGKGVIICPNAVLTIHIKFGDFVTLNLFCAIGHDAQIGDYAHLNSYAEVCGDVTLKEGVFMGTHSSVLPSLTVEKGATIGAGSIAVRSVKEGQTVIGVPAKVL